VTREVRAEVSLDSYWKMSMLEKGEFFIRLARSPLRMIPRRAVLPILTGALKGKKWIVGSSRHLCWVGAYERAMQQFVVREVKRGSVFYDVGANVGFYSLLAAGLVGTGRVFAFEPLTENVAYFAKHVKLNGITNVEVLEMAIADRPGVAHFQEEETRAMGKLAAHGTRQVTVSTLDALLEQQRITPPDFIKMDVEGAEFKALLGARVCFDQYRPKLFLATHGKEVHDECCHLLRAWRYDIAPIAMSAEEGRGELFATPVP
jgi:FkbM family methyltransferase